MMTKQFRATANWVVCVILLAPWALAQMEQISLQNIVTPSTVVSKNGQPVTFALHGFIEFKSLAEMFPYIENQAKRWPGQLSDDDRKALARDLLRRGIESRIVSMIDERPLESLLTHTPEELQQALTKVKEPTPDGYTDAFLAVQKKWRHSINCWSASSSLSARVLSNWYPITEGIPLYGATYDSTEHFWQAVKYHPAITIADLDAVLQNLELKDWNPWIARLDRDPKLYLPNAYAVEFLRHNLAPDRLRWFRNELTGHGLQGKDVARKVQQRSLTPFRFSAFEEKVLWGDLADLFHLIYTFSLPNDPLRQTLATFHFDGIYLDTGRVNFISEEFRSLMLDVWRVKYLQMARFGEVIRSIPLEIRIEHFLNDGNSPDIPIPIYVDYLNRIRDMARNQRASGP
jgi:hypothetical protein